MHASRLALAAAIAVAVLVGLTEPAHAWPWPLTGVAGGGCLPDGSRQSIVWVVTNLESANKGSPAVIDHVNVIPGFPTTSFSPSPMINDGASIAWATTRVPPRWLGNIQLSYRMYWSGSDGTDIRTGSAMTTLDYCFKPAPTTVNVTGRTRVRLRL